MYYDVAYAAYGETYASTGTQDGVFAGMEQDIVPSGSYPLYDALMREYHPTWGRWLSPDPAGLAVANPANPQSWNRYAYVVNNPLILTDPLGLGPGDPCTVNPDGTVTCPPTTVTVNGNDSNMNAGGGGASGGSGGGGMSDAGGTNFHCPPYLGRGRDCLAPPSPIATLPISTSVINALKSLIPNNPCATAETISVAPDVELGELRDVGLAISSITRTANGIINGFTVETGLHTVTFGRAAVAPLSSITFEFSDPAVGLTINANSGAIVATNTPFLIEASVTALQFNAARVQSVSGNVFFAGIPLPFGSTLIKNRLNSTPAALNALGALSSFLGKCATNP